MARWFTNRFMSYVWIEPLWNWNSLADLRIGLCVCLNWTFMELKWRYRSCKLESIFSFELNLYGIEISTPAQNTSHTGVFELNLYGIEISDEVLKTIQDARFELNLYGIEIQHGHLFRNHQKSLNWTFMELK